MPTFQLDKLVRDKFQKIYAELDETIVFRRLSGEELKEEICEKLLEEAAELSVAGATREKIIDEIGDIQQILDDMKTVYGISQNQVQEAMVKKFAKKGGFTEGLFVETITLKEGDPWIQYYRNEPQKYPEMSDNDGTAGKKTIK